MIKEDETCKILKEIRKMFRCENANCGVVTPARQPENRIVLETRPRTYENKIKRGKQKGTILTTHGSEIVKEIRVCPQCFIVLTGEKPKAAREAPVTPPRKKSRPSFRKKEKKQWTNPRDRKGNKNRPKKEVKEKKAPVVEVVNQLQVVKE